MNISDPLQTDSFEIESAFIHPHEGQKDKVAIDADAIKQFEYSEGLMQKYITVTLEIEDSTASLFESIFGMEEIEAIEEEERPRLATQVFLVICVVIMVMVFFLGM